MKAGKILVGLGFCTIFLAVAGYCQTSQTAVDWDYMGVRPIHDLAQDVEIKQKDIEQVPLSKNASIEIRRDNVKSIMSAVDRRTKRVIKKGELLMYSDLGTQSYFIDRPKPEFEPKNGCTVSYPYGFKP